MIETDDDWCVTKMITLIVHDEFERSMTLLRVKDKKKLVILTPAKVLALVTFEPPARPKFVIEIAAAQGMTRFGRCYTP